MVCVWCRLRFHTRAHSIGINSSLFKILCRFSLTSWFLAFCDRNRVFVTCASVITRTFLHNLAHILTQSCTHLTSSLLIFFTTERHFFQGKNRSFGASDATGDVHVTFVSKCYVCIKMLRLYQSISAQLRGLVYAGRFARVLVYICI
jgi:hypothetical protein